MAEPRERPGAAPTAKAGTSAPSVITTGGPSALRKRAKERADRAYYRWHDTVAVTCRCCPACSPCACDEVFQGAGCARRCRCDEIERERDEYEHAGDRDDWDDEAYP